MHIYRNILYQRFSWLGLIILMLYFLSMLTAQAENVYFRDTFDLEYDPHLEDLEKYGINGGGYGPLKMGSYTVYLEPRSNDSDVFVVVLSDSGYFGRRTQERWWGYLHDSSNLIVMVSFSYKSKEGVQTFSVDLGIPADDKVTLIPKDGVAVVPVDTPVVFEVHMGGKGRCCFSDNHDLLKRQLGINKTFFIDEELNEVRVDSNIKNYGWDLELTPKTEGTHLFIAELPGITGVRGDYFVMGEIEAISPCTYNITPTTHSHNQNAGNGNISVSASSSSCEWTANSNTSWITITSGGSGKGSGTVPYSITANTGTQNRSGTLSIAGKKVVIEQAFPPVNKPPTANFTALPTQGRVALTVNLDASSSTDPDGTIQTYKWTSSDGRSLFGVNPTMTFTEAGNYTIKLLVTDNDGAESSNTAQETITVKPPLHTLTVSQNGTGSCQIISTPQGIDCGSNCTQEYEAETSITLEATPNTGSAFSHFSGACQSTNPSCQVTMAQAQTVKVFCEKQQSLTVSTQGNGTVSFSPIGMSCGSHCQQYPVGTSVTVTAEPMTDQVFSGYEGACQNTTPSCQVIMNNDQSITAIFESPKQLTLKKQGNGTITTQPQGINCGEDCEEVYPSNQSVTLTASPDKDWCFENWSGDCSGDNCNVVMDTNKEITANFYFCPNIYTLTVTPQTNGTVNSVSSNMINCGNTNNDCTEEFEENAENPQKVSLKANPNAGFHFVRWEKDCSSSKTPTCEIILTDNRNVTAIFEPCYYYFEPSSRPPYNAEGGKDSVKINTPDGCQWAVNSDNSWLTITSEQSGKGESVVDYTIASNINTARREAALTTDNGQTAIKIIQDGNQPPISIAKLTPMQGSVPLTVSLDANDSYDPDGTISDYAWSSSDERSASGKTASLTFKTAGQYTITLTITDNMGKTTTAQKKVVVNGDDVVEPIAPVAIFTPDSYPISGIAPFTVELDATGSYDPDGGDIKKYDWSSSNGQSASGNKTTMTFEGGQYTISLTAHDDEGQTNTITKKVHVNTRPIAKFTATPDQGEAPLTVQLASTSSDFDGDKITHHWTSSDKQHLSGVNPTITFKEAGEYSISLMVEDSKGAESQTASTNIFVDVLVPAPPNITITAGKNGAVTSSLEGINCREKTCTKEIKNGKTITLTAKPDAGYHVEWRQGCSSINALECKVVMDGDKNVEATFIQEGEKARPGTVDVSSVKLILTIDGSGKVLGQGMNCSSHECTPRQINDALLLTATASPGSTFGGWKGEACQDSKTVSCNVTLSKDKNQDGEIQMTALFESCTYEITHSQTHYEAEGGKGELTINAPKDCEWKLETDQDELKINGKSSGKGEGRVKYTLKENTAEKSRTAQFRLVGREEKPITITQDGTKTEKHTLKVKKIGKGSVKGTAGINCGTQCSNEYSEGATLDLKAEPIEGYSFISWQGAEGCDTETTCPITITNNQEVTAKFQACQYTFEAPSRSHHADAIQENVELTTVDNCQWTVEIEKACEDWLTLTSETGQGKGSIAYSLSDNVAEEDRSCELQIGGKKLFTIKQLANKPPIATLVTESSFYGTVPLTLVLESRAKDADGTIKEYRWISSDGQSLSGESVEITYGKAGRYILSHEVVDNRGAISSNIEQRFVVVKNGPQHPVARFTLNPESGKVPLSLNLDGRKSYDDEKIISYYWESSDGQKSLGRQTTLTLNQPGTVVISLTVVDNEGLTGTVEQTVVVDPEPEALIADFTVTPSNGIAPLEATLDASQSSPQSEIVQYQWSTDGQKASGRTATLHFDESGIKTIVLIITDKKKRTSRIEKTMIVKAKPIARFKAIPNVLKPSKPVVQLDASEAFDPDPDDLIVQYNWTASNGEKASGEVTSMRFDKPGQHEIELIVVDSDGLSSAIAKQTITVMPEETRQFKPIAIIDAEETDRINRIVRVKGNRSRDIDGRIQEFIWTTSDGQTATGKEATLKFERDGEYRLTLKTVDNDGLSGEETQTVTVGEVIQVSLEGLKPFYRVGDPVQIDLVENVKVKSRFHRVDLWVAVGLPNKEFRFKTPSELVPFDKNPQPFKSSLEKENGIHRLFSDFDVVPGLGGEYVIYAVYIEAGKNLLKESDTLGILRSNVVQQSIILANLATLDENRRALKRYAGLVGVDDMTITDEGEISLTLNGTTLYGRLLEPTIPGTPPSDASVKFNEIDDANEDGLNDYEVIYPNGDRQTMLYFDTDKP